METEEEKLNLEFNANVFNIFKHFMARVTEFEELVTVGRKSLTGFQQGLEFLWRPPIDNTSELVKTIINNEGTKELQSYFVSGCINTHDSVQNTIKCQIILDQLESLLDDANDALQNALGNFPPFLDRTTGVTMEAKEELASCCSMHKASDLALLMVFIYQMVKEDYTMQEKIVSGLNMKSSSGELESYCLMWSLRPFVNDGIMVQAWKLIP